MPLLRCLDMIRFIGQLVEENIRAYEIRMQAWSMVLQFNEEQRISVIDILLRGDGGNYSSAAAYLQIGHAHDFDPCCTSSYYGFRLGKGQ